MQITGDGAMGFHIQEFDTMVRHRLPICTIVFNQPGLGDVDPRTADHVWRKLQRYQQTWRHRLCRYRGCIWMPWRAHYEFRRPRGPSLDRRDRAVLHIVPGLYPNPNHDRDAFSTPDHFAVVAALTIIVAAAHAPVATRLTIICPRLVAIASLIPRLLGILVRLGRNYLRRRDRRFALLLGERGPKA